MWCNMKLTPMFGADIISCIESAIEIAGRMSVPVQFSFNGYTLYITESSNKHIEYNKYREWMNT